MKLPRIREIREERKYTQLYMAEKMGISQPQYCRLERDGNLSVEQLVQISMILDTTVEELTKNHKACKHINL